jgi:hypothetical protein
MKRLLVLVLLSLSPAAYPQARPNNTLVAINGYPAHLGTIVATTTKNNHDTASAFSNTGAALKGMVLMVQCDAAAYVLPGTANTATVTTGNGVKLEANEKFIFIMGVEHGWLAALAVSGTANCKVWRLQ